MISYHDEIIREIEQRRFDLGLGLLKVFNYYRVLVGLTLLTVFSQNLMGSRLGNLEPSLFLWVILSYMLINLGPAGRSRPDSPPQRSSQVPTRYRYHLNQRFEYLPRRPVLRPRCGHNSLRARTG